MVRQELFPVLVARRVEHRSHTLEVHDRNLVDTASGNEGEPAVRGDRDIGRVREVVVGFVEQELVDPSIVPQHSDAVGHHPTLQHTRHGDQVFGANQSHQGELTVRRHVDPLHQVGLGDHEAVVHHRARGGDDRHLGSRRRPEGHEMREVVGDVHLIAIG